MIRSASEVSALVAKAVRGAGLPLGLAEDLAAAIPRHVAEPADGALEALAAYLSDPAPLLAHASALDLAMAEGRRPPHPPCPCLSALTACLAGAAARTPARPLSVSPEIWTNLEHWAARTYVPATEASRQAGAGAGLTDND